MKALFLILIAFVVYMEDGKEVLIRDAVGFAIIEVEKIACHGFFDRTGKPLLAIPSALIKGAVYIPDDKVI